MPDAQNFNKHLLTGGWNIYLSPEGLLKMQNTYFNNAVIAQTIFWKELFFGNFL